ncbi:hypothetical protein D1AOALGA4SA_7993 [Olavius algarvensis Delta 1 endosymbiont]|nr:hypothetical protein D1AOALGA4SA_7993 [Olavius algarvensis Delta 1 endosymbiont]
MRGQDLATSVTDISYETTFKANRRISNKKYRMMKGGIASL